jgi:hypothetical protein
MHCSWKTVHHRRRKFGGLLGTLQVEMGKNPKLWVLVRVRVLGKAGSVRVRVLCIPSKFGFGSVRVLRDSGLGSGSSS